MHILDQILTAQRLARLVAGLLLLAFGFSHLLGAIFPSVKAEHQSLVAPFLTYKQLFSIAAAIEIVAGVICIRKRSSNVADSALFMTLIALIWYRWARLVVGEFTACGCTGVLGPVFGVTAHQEDNIASATLFVLWLCLSPRILSLVLHSKFFSQARCAVILVLALSGLPSKVSAKPVQGVTLSGTLTNFWTPGKEYEGRRDINVPLDWRLTIGDDGSWSIFSTNRFDRGMRAYASYSGGVSYFIQPSMEVHGTNINSDRLLDLAVVGNGPQVLLFGTDHCGITHLWMAFCSQLAWEDYLAGPEGQTNRSPNWPVHAWSPKDVVRSWGFRWQFNAGDSNMSPIFPQKIDGLRLARLPTFEELLKRKEIMHPRSASSLNDYKQIYGTLMAFDPGSPAFEYRVLSEADKAGNRYPNSAEIRYFKPIGVSEVLPYWRVRISVDKAEFGSVSPLPPPTVINRTSVSDTRYAFKTDQKNLPQVIYNLSVGERWKGADDPELKAKVEWFLLNGPTLGAEIGVHAVHYKIYFIFIIVATAPLVIYYLSRKTAKPPSDATPQHD